MYISNLLSNKAQIRKALELCRDFHRLVTDSSFFIGCSFLQLVQTCLQQGGEGATKEHSKGSDRVGKTQ